MSGFAGFGADTTRFLSELAEHNDREWFAANRERYETVLLKRQREFVEALREQFAVIDPDVVCDPATNRSIFRINRDIRFSRDKSPYKTHADMWFWKGNDRKQSPGYFVRIVPDAVWAGGGQHWLTPEQLASLRAAVLADTTGTRLSSLLDGFEADGWAVGDQTLARVPRGMPADHPRAGLLRFTTLQAIDTVSPIPAEFASEEFVGWCLERFERVRPLVDWLAANV